MFNHLFEEFGNNPFLSNLSNRQIVETTSPLSKGDIFNHEGINYTVYNDVGARKSLLLVADGEIAIGETTNPLDVNSERLVLDRRVNLVSNLERELPFLWSISEVEQSSFITEYLKRNKTYRIPYLDLDSRFVWVDEKYRKNALGLSKEKFQLIINNKPFLEEDFPNTIKKLGKHQSSNSWVWAFNNISEEAPFIFEDFVQTPDYNLVANGIAVSMTEDFVIERPLSQIEVSNLAQNPKEGRITESNWSGSVNFINGLSFPLSYKTVYFWLYNSNFDQTESSNVPRSFQNTLDNRVSTISTVKPRLLDTYSNRAIYYQLDNYKIDASIHDVGKDGDNICTKYEISGTAKAFYHNFETGEKIEINSFGPYSIPITRTSLSGIKADYEVGDSLSVSYPSKTVGQGFTSNKGHYTEAAGEVNLSIDCADEPAIPPACEPNCKFSMSRITHFRDFRENQATANPNYPNSTNTDDFDWVGADYLTVIESPLHYFDADLPIPAYPTPNSRASASGYGPPGASYPLGGRYGPAVFEVVDNATGNSIFDNNGKVLFAIRLTDSSDTSHFEGEGTPPSRNNLGGTWTEVCTPITSPCVREEDPNPDDPGNTNDPTSRGENRARQEEKDHWDTLTTTPFEAWGYLPTSDGFSVGVKVRVISFSSTESDFATVLTKHHYETDFPYQIPLVKLEFITNVSFEIIKVGTEKIPHNSDTNFYKRLYKSEPSEVYDPANSVVGDSIKGYSNLSEPVEGFLKYGNGFGICGSSPLDHPESVALNMPLDIHKFYTEDLPYGSGVIGNYRYIWEIDKDKKDCLWAYPSDLSFIDNNFSKLYVPKFEFVLRDGGSLYDLIFLEWTELDLKRSTRNLDDISFHIYNEGRKRPLRRV